MTNLGAVPLRRSGLIATCLAAMPYHPANLALRRTVRTRARPILTMSVSTAESFGKLGVSPLLLPALEAAGIGVPTDVQRAAFSGVLSGDDAILLSETGSGKTLAYALPILHRLLAQAGYSPTTGELTAPLTRPRDQALVLAPNRDLCAQVHTVLQGLVEALPTDAREVIDVSSLCSDSADADASILVSTPPVALKLWRGARSVRWVVLDEADLLLAGSFKRAARANYPIEMLIADVKRSAKEEALVRAQQPSREEQPSREQPSPGELVEPPWQCGGSADTAAGSAGRSRVERDARHYASKQFVLVGATMPNAGTKNIEEHVKVLFPRAGWYRAPLLHQKKAEMRHFFVTVDDQSRATALRQALRHGPPGKVIVFANGVATAELAHAEVCSEVGEERCALFHGEVPPEVRARTLAAFDGAPADAPPVLVCTGLAARGIDFVGVGHVIQYEVATNAVEFMHRVGRTARAGREGVCTTLYTADRAELVEGLRDALADGRSVEHLFSRKRSLTLKRKKALRRQEEDFF